MALKTQIALALAAAIALALARAAAAHCDGLDGPVVAAARIALQTGEVGGALAWVQPAADAEVRRAFVEFLHHAEHAGGHGEER